MKYPTFEITFIFSSPLTDNEGIDLTLTTVIRFCHYVSLNVCNVGLMEFIMQSFVNDVWRMCNSFIHCHYLYRRCFFPCLGVIVNWSLTLFYGRSQRHAITTYVPCRLELNMNHHASYLSESLDVDYANYCHGKFFLIVF